MQKLFFSLLLLVLPVAADEIQYGREISNGPVTIQVIGISAAGLAGIPTPHPGFNMVQVFLRTSNPETSAFRVTLKTPAGIQRTIVEPFAVRQYWHAVALFWMRGKPTGVSVEELANSGAIDFP